MNDLNCSRRLDSLGRIVFPKKLRALFGMEEGTEYQFYSHEEDGKTYLCIEVSNAESEIEKAKALLEKAGYQVGSHTNA